MRKRGNIHTNVFLANVTELIHSDTKHQPLIFFRIANMRA